MKNEKGEVTMTLNDKDITDLQVILWNIYGKFLKHYSKPEKLTDSLVKMYLWSQISFSCIIPNPKN